MVTTRLRAIIAVSALGFLAVMLPVAGPSRSQVTTRAVTVPCKPADQLTNEQRAALVASLQGNPGIRDCTSGTSTTINLTAYQKFLSKTSFQFTNVSLSDQACDGRSVFADANDQNGFQIEFVNSKGCNTTAYWAGPIHVSSPYNVNYVRMALYACNSTSCSSVVWSKYHYNPYRNAFGDINSTFDFCNATGGTIGCFYAKLN